MWAGGGGCSGGKRGRGREGVVPTSPVPAVDILEAVRQSMQTYEALYIGSLPVPRAMGKCRQPRLSWGMPENPAPWGNQAARGAGWQHPACSVPAAGAGADGTGSPAPQGWTY